MRFVNPFLLATLAGIIATAPLCSPASAGDDAEDVAEDIFRHVEKACPVGGEGLPYNLATIAEEYFVPDLRDVLRRAYDNQAIEFDILIDAQDCEIPDIDLDEVGDDDDDRDRMTVQAKFDNFGEQRVVNMLMVRAGDDWKVADIAYGHRDWQLLRDLEHPGGK